MTDNNLISDAMVSMPDRDSDADDVEQSFGLETGRYRRESGEFADGSPPPDFDSDVRRFRAQDGRFKDRARDLGAGTPHDAPAEDAATNAYETSGEEMDNSVDDAFDFEIDI